jgi:hypothetical protein
MYPWLRGRLARHWPIILPCVLTAAVFHAWLQPGPIIGADWVRRVPAELNGFFPWPHVWNGSQQLGETNEVYLNYFPLFALMGLLSRLHLPWSVIERLLFLFPYLVLSVVAPYALAYRLTRSAPAASVGASLFTVNTWIVMATERGAIPSIVAASLLPWFFCAVLAFIERATVRRGVGLSLILTAVLIYDLRYVYIGVIFAIVLSAEALLRDRSLRRAIRAVPALVAAVVTALVLNLYWIVPQFFEPASAGAGYGSLDDYIGNSHFMSPAHSLADFAVFYHWVATNNPFRADPADWYFFLLPVAVFVSLAACWKRKWIWSFAVGAFVAVLLDSGPTFPLDGINIWIFTHVPGMSFFRDVTKWMSLLEITYGTIVAYGVARFAAYLRAIFGARAFRRGAWFLPTVVVAVYALLMGDAFNVTRYRVFATYRLQPELAELERFIAGLPANQRILLLPRDSEPMRATLAHPYAEAMQLENSASPDGVRDLDMHWGDRLGLYSAPFAPDLLRTFNVKYVVVPYDYDKIMYSQYIANTGYFDTVDYAMTRPWLRFIRKIGREYVFELRDSHPAAAFIAPVPFVLNGSGPALATLTGTPLVNARMAAVMADQPLPGIWRRIPNYVKGGWAIDVNEHGMHDAAAYIRQARELERAANDGAFPFVAAAGGTGNASSSLVAFDDPTLLDAPFTYMGSPRLAYSANVRNVAPLHRLLASAGAFAGRAVRSFVPANETLFAYDNGFEVQPAGMLNSAPSGYAGSLAIINNNPVAASGRLVLDGLAFSNGERDASLSYQGRTWTCRVPTCTLEDITLSPGPNPVRVSIDAAHDVKGVSLVAGPIARLYDERINTGAFFFSRSLASTDIAMTELPHVSMRFDSPVRMPLYVLYDLVSRWNGERRTLIDRAGNNPEYDAEPAALADRVLTEAFQRSLAEHARDQRWLGAHRLSDEPDGGNAWRITRIRLAALATDRAAAAELDAMTAPHLRVYRTPTAPELAGDDAPRFGVHTTLPLPGRVSLNGMTLERLERLPGVMQMSLRSTGAQPKATLAMSISEPSGPHIGFDVLEDPHATIHIELRTPAGNLLFYEDLTPDKAQDLFGSGTMQSVNAGDAAWPLGSPHCEPVACPEQDAPAGLSGQWKHLEIDTSALFAAWRSGVRVTIAASPLVGTARIRFGLASGDAWTSTAHGVPPALTLDGNLLPAGAMQPLPGTDFTNVRGSVALRPATLHRIASYPSYPQRPISLALMNGAPERFAGADLRDARVFSDVEVDGRIESHGGLLVFDEAYDPMWTLALVPPEARLSGFALLDYLRYHSYAVPERDHYKVDDILNAWWVPSGRLHPVFLMRLDAFVQLGAIVWSIASILWLAAVLAATRRRKA